MACALNSPGWMWVSPLYGTSLDELSQTSDSVEFNRAMVDEGPGPLEEASRLETSASIRAFTDNLDPIDSVLFDGYYQRGETQVAMAKQVGMSQPAVHGRLKRMNENGRTVLADFLTEQVT